MKYILMILLCLPLLSLAPVPAALPPATIARHPVSTIVTPRARAARPPFQACTWETAPARLRQQIEDPIGYPYGEVSAWSCAGDSAAVVAELNQRVRAMQAEAAAYRAAHPIVGVMK